MTAPLAGRPVTGVHVEVNENAVFATRLGADRWVAWRYRASDAWEQRFEVVNMNPQGGLHRIRCDDREDAQQLRDMLVAWGLPPRAVRVRGAR